MRKSQELSVCLSTELSGVDLCDSRNNQRLWQIVEQIAARPSATFPEAMGDEAGLEGFYRFINNERVTHERILEPHLEQSRARCEEAGRVLVAHDTTEARYGGEVRREGLGRMQAAGQGYFAHTALAISADGRRRPLGVVGLAVHTRSLEKQTPETKEKRKRHAQPDTEFQRWIALVRLVEAQSQGRFQAVHLMDREADASALLSELVQLKASFIVRCYRNRPLYSEDSSTYTVDDALSQALPVVSREVAISRRTAKRPPRSLKKHPARDARLARLSISACSVIVKPSAFAGTKELLRLNCVHVVEVDCPEGEEPVEWRLWTTLPVETPEQILDVVDSYRARWLIEELFKSLKSGCGLEKRQSESLPALLNVLAILIPVAWRMLLLRHVARFEPDAPASAVLTPTQLAILASVRAHRWPPSPSARDALLAVAALGGHIRNNGDPGWMVLGRGMETLLTLELGWTARDPQI